MDNLVQFIYESGICLAVLFVLHWLVLRKETYFRFNRFYLLGTLVISCTLPLVNVGVSVFDPVTSSSSVVLPLMETIRMPELPDLGKVVTLKNMLNGVGFVLSFSFKDDVLKLTTEGQPETRMIPLSQTKFEYEGIEASIEFTRDEQGKVTGFEASNGRTKGIRFERF